MSPAPVPYEQAWQQALYGPDGFYRRAAPHEHFRTSVTAGALLASALARLAREAGLHRVVDVGAGRGRLLADLHAADPGLELLGLDVVPRPPDLPDAVGWRLSPGGAGLPDGLGPELAGALVVAHEWLDDVPCPVAQRDGTGRWRQVLVDPVTGEETLGEPVDGAELAWLREWWPGADAAPPGERAEVGTTRDAAWAGLVRAAREQEAATLLLAVDYAHHRDDRPPDGTLLGYRDGAAGPPVPDGRGDVTAHVALDAVAAAGRAAGAEAGRLTTQRTALRALGVDGRLPSTSLVATDPRGYLAALERASHAAELLEPGALGGFGWLLQPIGPAGQVEAAVARLTG